MVPFTSRMLVVRSVTASTDPVTPRAPSTVLATSIWSPTPNWSSISRKTPPRKSRTIDCAPKPSATPTIPAPAIRGPTLAPSAANE